MSRVAIACQGGGSHTAFTAGVLKHVLEHWDESDELVGLSGTSGGAINAAAVWYGLATGGRDHAIELLDAIWNDIAADGPFDRVTNEALVWTRRMDASGFPGPSVSPYFSPVAGIARDDFQALIERHIDFETIQSLCADPERPELVVGTVDVNAGEFETFTNESVSSKAVLASAAIPEMFQAVEIHGHDHWDGLFSQNPPVYDLMVGDSERKPEELWIIQINSQKRAETPRTSEEIANRRNELAGNISLNQELGFIERVNEWVDEGYLPEEKFSKTTIRRIEMDETLGAATKVDRSPELIERLMELGESQAETFLEERR